MIAASCAPNSGPQRTPSGMVVDQSGSAALRAAAPPTRTTFLDDLSGEEAALASAVLLQARVERAGPTSDRFTGRVVSVFLGHQDRELSPESRLVFFNETGYALPESSAPILSLYRNDRIGAYATLSTTAVGYADGDTLIYRRRNGAVDRYSLRSSDNLFGCIQLASTMQRDSCRIRRLAHYGVRSAAQLNVFIKLQRTDAWTTALWMLVRKHDSRALFPTTECRDNKTTECASWAAFKTRIGLEIPND